MLLNYCGYNPTIHVFELMIFIMTRPVAFVYSYVIRYQLNMERNTRIYTPITIADGSL